MASQFARSRLFAVMALLNELGTKTGEFCVRDRSSFLETVKLLYLVSDTEPNNPSALRVTTSIIITQHVY